MLLLNCILLQGTPLPWHLPCCPCLAPACVKTPLSSENPLPGLIIFFFPISLWDGTGFAAALPRSLQGCPLAPCWRGGAARDTSPSQLVCSQAATHVKSRQRSFISSCTPLPALVASLEALSGAELWSCCLTETLSCSQPCAQCLG